MTTPEISALLLFWMEVASKRKMLELRKSLCDCRDILDGLLDAYPAYAMSKAAGVRKALAGMNQGDEQVIEIQKAFEEKVKEFA